MQKWHVYNRIWFGLNGYHFRMIPDLYFALFLLLIWFADVCLTRHNFFQDNAYAFDKCWFVSGTCDMSTTKNKKKRMYLAMCSITNQLGWCPPQVASALDFWASQEVWNPTSGWTSDWAILEVRIAHFGRCGLPIVELSHFVNLKDALSVLLIFGENNKNPKDIRTFLRKWMKT